MTIASAFSINLTTQVGRDMSQARYRAFVSYSRRDARAARRLHKALESYRLPKGVAADVDTKTRKLGRFFLDNDELGASTDLGAALRGALDESGCLIVVASPDAAASHWVNEEVLHFRRQAANKPILAAIVRGRPGAAQEDEPERECFPPALRGAEKETDAVEPLGVSLKAQSFAKARTRLVAGILGIPFDRLWKREARRRQAVRLTWILTSTVIIFAVVLGAGIASIASDRQALAQVAAARNTVGEQSDHGLEFTSATPFIVGALPSRDDVLPTIAGTVECAVGEKTTFAVCEARRSGLAFARTDRGKLAHLPSQYAPTEPSEGVQSANHPFIAMMRQGKLEPRAVNSLLGFSYVDPSFRFVTEQFEQTQGAHVFDLQAGTALDLQVCQNQGRVSHLLFAARSTVFVFCSEYGTVGEAALWSIDLASGERNRLWGDGQTGMRFAGGVDDGVLMIASGPELESRETAIFFNSSGSTRKQELPEGFRFDAVSHDGRILVGHRFANGNYVMNDEVVIVDSSTGAVAPPGELPYLPAEMGRGSVSRTGFLAADRFFVVSGPRSFGDSVVAEMSKGTQAVSLWGVKSGREEETLVERERGFAAVVPSRDGGYMAVAQLNDLIRVFDVTTHAEIARVRVASSLFPNLDLADHAAGVDYVENDYSNGAAVEHHDLGTRETPAQLRDRLCTDNRLKDERTFAARDRNSFTTLKGRPYSPCNWSGLGSVVGWQQLGLRVLHAMGLADDFQPDDAELHGRIFWWGEARRAEEPK